MNGNGSDRVKFGSFEADLRTHELWKDGTRVKLVGQPFEVLAILLSKPGELVTRDELGARLWQGDTFVDFNHGLNAAVNKLREALSDSAEAPRYVETLPRRGYRFIAPVEFVAPIERQNASSAIAAPLAIQEPAASAILFVDSVDAEIEAPKVRAWRPYFIASILGVTLLAGIGGAFLSKKASSKAAAAEGHLPLQRVRPLTSLPDETSEPAFSFDSNYVAFRRQGVKPEDSGIFVKAVGGDQLTQLTRNAGDCCPVWSPDGRSVAFSRSVNKDFSIYMVSSAGGQERKVDTGSVVPRRGEMDWSPDGKTIAFSGGAHIFLLLLADSTVHRLAEPPPLSEDWGPAFSPDGKKMLFVRSNETGFPEEIMAVPTAGGDVTRITSEHARILGPPRWSSDGQSVIFASDRDSHPALWRVSAEVRDSPVEINDSGWYPAISRRGYRLAYQRVTRSLNVWQMDLSAPGKQVPHILVPSTSETDQGPGPQFSPDGKKLAFMSDRSGTMEIWVSDRDGGNPFQLTAIGGAGTPRWSPDSQSIVFDARARKGEAVYVVDLQGGAPRMLTPDGAVPSWSRDGKWIYFASENADEWQVWKVQAAGGTPVQVTVHGGHATLESPDGKYVYYAKTLYANPEIWQVPVAGGAEKLVSPLLRPFTWASWSVVEKGIVFAGPSANGRPAISLFDFAKHRVTNLGALDVVPFWLGATRDGKTVVFDQPGWEQAQIMLAENFR